MVHRSPVRRADEPGRRSSAAAGTGASPRRRRELGDVSRQVLCVLLSAVVAGLGGCGGDGEADPVAPGVGDPAVIRVGPAGDHRTIQDAVDAARPGDLVLVEPGTYREAVKIDTDRLVVRGTNRNGVVLDGGAELLNGFEVTSDQVAIENLTVQHYAVNGVLFAAPHGGGEAQGGPVGWRASHVTATANGLYGLYAFGTGPGQFDHNYASAHPDSGIYVGQCRDCGAVVIANVAERNAIGFESTNASDVFVARNEFRGNRIGMAINSGAGEELAPQKGGTVAQNVVVDNDDPATPETRGGFGVGIVLAGGSGNEVRDNVVTGHAGAGIVLVDQDGYGPVGNRVTGNTVGGNGVDLLLAAEDGGVPEATGTCFSDNEADDGVVTAAATTRPPDLQTLLACDRPPVRLPVSGLDLPDGPAGIAAADVVPPTGQPDMPDADDLTWSAPPLRPEAPDLDRVTVPGF
jgi:parallel beta-helix repeat protein